MSTRQRLASYVLLALVLAGVFALYLHPQLLIDLANQLWTCM